MNEKEKEEEEKEEGADDACESIISAICNEGKIVMVIKVKQRVTANFQQINSRDTIELLIYCNYLMRLKKLERIMGTITDGHT